MLHLQSYVHLCPHMYGHLLEFWSKFVEVKIMEDGKNCEKNAQETEVCEETPIDLTTHSSESSNVQIKRKKRRLKKFAKLNVSEEAMEERRRSANDLERKRMKKMSEALDQLRKCIPQHFHLYHRRTSKIRTLRLATSYIKALNEMLEKDMMKEMVHNAYRNIHYNVIQSPVVYPGITVNASPSATAMTPYSGHLHQTPRRHLDFSPGYPGFLSTTGTPGGPHQLYQTPVPSGVTPSRHWHRPSHTITSPEPEDGTGERYSDNVTSRNMSSANFNFPRKSSCRYESPYIEGIYPLPEEDHGAEWWV